MNGILTSRQLLMCIYFLCLSFFGDIEYLHIRSVFIRVMQRNQITCIWNLFYMCPRVIFFTIKPIEKNQNNSTQKIPSSILLRRAPLNWSYSSMISKSLMIILLVLDEQNTNRFWGDSQSIEKIILINWSLLSNYVVYLQLA